jgi:hypothetical protein
LCQTRDNWKLKQRVATLKREAEKLSAPRVSKLEWGWSLGTAEADIMAA